MDREKIKQNLLEIFTSREHMSLQLSSLKIEEDTSLLKDLVLDSIQILELLVAIENRFKITITNKELNLDYFDRFSLLIDFVQEKLSEKNQSGALAPKVKGGDRKYLKVRRSTA